MKKEHVIYSLFIIWGLILTQQVYSHEDKVLSINVYQQICNENFQTALKLNRAEITMAPGDQDRIYATASSGTGTYTWTSSNESVATVNKVGIVNAINYGEATITCTEKGGATATCKVKVVSLAETFTFSTVYVASATVKDSTIYDLSDIRYLPEGKTDSTTVHVKGYLAETTISLYSKGAYYNEMGKLDGPITIAVIHIPAFVYYIDHATCPELLKENDEPIYYNLTTQVFETKKDTVANGLLATTINKDAYWTHINAASNAWNDGNLETYRKECGLARAEGFYGAYMEILNYDGWSESPDYYPNYIPIAVVESAHLQLFDNNVYDHSYDVTGEIQIRPIFGDGIGVYFEEDAISGTMTITSDGLELGESAKQIILGDNPQNEDGNFYTLTTNSLGGCYSDSIKASEGTIVTIDAVPIDGYQFFKWSDGITENPRTIILSQDTTITAIFEAGKSGKCGDNLWWSIDGNTLKITGIGDMSDYNIKGVHYAPWYYSYSTSIKSVIIENGVTSIGNTTFYGCSSLTSVTIGNNVTSIGNFAFSGCSSLTSVTIPNSVTSIGWGAFEGCSSLKAVHISDIATWCKIHYFGDAPDRINDFNPLKYAGNLYLNGKLVTDLVIPNSVTSIGLCAFEGCTSLTSVIIPNSVTSIGTRAFSDCNNLTSLSIGNGITSISPIDFYGCNKLKSITIEATSPPLLYDVSSCITTFNLESSIYVPYGALNTYKLDENWKKYNLHVINPSHTSISTASTSVQIAIGNSTEKAHIQSCGMTGGEEFSGNIIEYIGLEPNSQYSNVPFFVKTREGDYDGLTLSFNTPALKLKTLQSKAVSENTAILLAETNMSDLETSCGFEYKRNDAPEDMPATQVICPVANGLMAGRLKGLRNDTYYKYRAFYKSTAGNMHYGDWQYIFTGDVAVEFDPILYTYAAQFVGEHEATLKGYALAGSEDFTEQGFEYWAESRSSNSSARRTPQYEIGEKHTVKGSGISMRITLENLDEGTVYKYRTYAKVGNQTIYGSEMSFITEGEYIANGLDDVVNDNQDNRSPRATKVFENGQLYILLPDGTRYNLQGQEVK